MNFQVPEQSRATQLRSAQVRMQWDGKRTPRDDAGRSDRSHLKNTNHRITSDGKAVYCLELVKVLSVRW